METKRREPKVNTGDFGTVHLEGGKWFFRFRSFVSLATGEIYQERRSQKFLLAAVDTSLYKNRNSSALHLKAAEQRTKIIALETNAKIGQTVGGSATAPEVKGDITVAEFFEKYFLPFKRTKAASTLATYDAYWNAAGYGLKHHFNSHITIAGYQARWGRQFLNGLRKEDGSQYGARTITKLKSIASEIFNVAMEEYGLIDHNPWRDVNRKNISSNPSQKKGAYTEAEVVSIIRNIGLGVGDASKPLMEARDTNIRNASLALAVCFWAGLRPEECAALRWENVDVVKGTIKVAETVVKVKGQFVHRPTTKTDKIRVVFYLEPLADILREWHQRNGCPTSGLVLQKNGDYVDLGDLSEQIVAPSCKKYGFDKWRGNAFYGCRRGCGTHLAQVVKVSDEFGSTFLGNSRDVYREHYEVTDGSIESAEVARLDRARRLEQAQAAERQELTPAALGLSDGGAL